MSTRRESSLLELKTEKVSLGEAELLTDIIESKKSSAENVLARRIFSVHPPNYKTKLIEKLSRTWTSKYLTRPEHSSVE